MEKKKTTENNLPDNSFPDNANMLKTQIAALSGLIEKQKKEIEDLAASAEQFRLLLKHSPDIIYVLKPDGTITLVSQAVSKLGVIPEDVIGKNFFTFVHPEDTEKMIREFMETVTTGREFPTITRLVNNDGRVFFMEDYGGAVLKDGEVVQLVGVTRDITQRKQIEDKLKYYAADMARANEELKEFTYIVSHDLRAPLINMKGFAAEIRSMIKELESGLEATRSDPGEQREKMAAIISKDLPEALNFIDSSATHMDGFLNALLKLSRLGRKELVFEPLNPTEIIETIVKGLAHQLEEHHAKVTVGSLPEITGDRTSIDQIIGNILTNAVKYLDPSRPGEIEITGDRGEEETVFCISDNGRGITKEDIPKVFMPFRRVGKQNTKGEGMGLAFAQALAHRHGGYIRCESEPGVGTKFIITISNHPEQKT